MANMSIILYDERQSKGKELYQKSLHLDQSMLNTLFSILKSSLTDNLFIFSLYSIFTAILCILAHLRSSKTFYIFTLPTSEIGHRILPPIFLQKNNYNYHVCQQPVVWVTRKWTKVLCIAVSCFSSSSSQIKRSWPGRGPVLVLGLHIISIFCFGSTFSTEETDIDNFYIC